MKLLTNAIIEALPPLYATDGVPLEEKIVICKFFHRASNWTWFVFEGEKQEDGDYLFFGMVHGFEKEMGYFVLSELSSITEPMPIERDLHVFREPYSKFM
jgi:hypothetical protein